VINDFLVFTWDAGKEDLPTKNIKIHRLWNLKLTRLFLPVCPKEPEVVIDCCVGEIFPSL
jgi:hypothetical protein